MKSWPVREELRRMSIGELVAIALADLDVEKDLPTPGVFALAELHDRGSREVLEAAQVLCSAEDAKRRILGARILGELRRPGVFRSFPEECCDSLLHVLTQDKNTEVMAAALFALGHLGNRRADRIVAGFCGHPDSLVRHGVAFALAGGSSPEGIAAQLELMRDDNVMARDWATTGIGMTAEIDGPEIRAALLGRIDDDDEIVRAEAVHGLVRRRDSRCVIPLIAELSDPQDRDYLFEAAAKDWLGIGEEAEISCAELMTRLQDEAKSHSADP